MTGIPSNRPEFFGRDDFVPFIGRVEDVNDPKHGHRVKVRCIGWHPKSKKSSKDGDEDGLATDDLPWARVAMPTTHAQQGRIGGKHGLLNGCWVFGFFLDGSEAQDPMVLNTINFTPNASDADDRKTLMGEDGKDAEEDDAFSKSNLSPQTAPGNAALHTEEERGKGHGHSTDKGGDGHAYDHDATKCGGKAVNESRASKERKKEENTKQTPTGQNTDNLQGDGRCGTTMHARDDMRALIKSYMPAGDSRYNYGDAVWDAYTGNYLNLGGIMAQLAIAICSELKQPINSQKAKVNKTMRAAKSAACLVTFDRDGVMRPAVEDKKSMAGDSFNATMQTSLIDKLCDIMMKLLQAIQNGGDPSTGIDGPGGRSPTTPILDPGAICITDTILRNIEVIVDSTIEIALAKAEEEAEEYDPEKNPLFSAGMGYLQSLAAVMQFPLIDVYAEVPGAFNKKGNKSQDADNKSGECRQDRIYNTELGSLQSIAGFSVGEGGSGGSGGGSRGGVQLPDVGFGGKDRNDDSEPTTILCDDAYKRPRKDRGEPTPGGGMPIDDENLIDLRCNDTKQCPKGFICIDGMCVSPDRPWPPGFNDEGLIPCDDAVDLFEGVGNRRRYYRQGGCPDGMVCFNGYCVPESGLLECSEDEDCPEGQICISGVCVSAGNEFDEPGPFEGIGGENYVPGAGNDFQEPGEFQGIGKEGYILGAQNKFVPGGEGARIITTSLPSSDIRCARNFFNGTPNQSIVIRRGTRYFFNNPEDDTRVFPSVYVKGYASQPVPVVDRFSGEMVAVLTACSSFNPNSPSAPVTVIPDSSTTGIVTDDPAYDITLGGLFIANTGFDYVDPIIEIFDRDKQTYENAKATLVVKDGRIVDYEIINNGTQFRRLPDIRIVDRDKNGSVAESTGYGAEVYPIMNVVERDKAKPLPEPIQRIFCPSNQLNGV